MKKKTEPIEESKIPKIDPVPEGVHRPLWSVVIPTYNCARFLGQTLESVLCQDPGEDKMEIEVLDNQSTDRPEDVVEKIGKGRVKFFRHATNIGAYANMNVGIQRSRGHLIHILHGDDYVEKGFYREVEIRAAVYPQLALFATRGVHVDEDGEIEQMSPRVPFLEQPSHDVKGLYYQNPFLPAGIVVRREFYQIHEGFNEALKCADWEMWVRAISQGGGIIINRCLCAYRSHGDNMSALLHQQGLYMEDFLRVATVFKTQFRDFRMDVMWDIMNSGVREKALKYLEKGESRYESSWVTWKRTFNLKMKIKRTMTSQLEAFKDIYRYVVCK